MIARRYEEMRRIRGHVAAFETTLANGAAIMGTILTLAGSDVTDQDTGLAPPEAREWAAAQLKAFVADGMPASRLTEVLADGMRLHPGCRCLATLMLHALASELRAGGTVQ